MIDAKDRHDNILSKRSTNLTSAASRYRERRGRHPPPGFDQWVKAAIESNAIIIEDFFDRIYKDLVPFWSLDSDTIARRASAWHWVVKVRNGTAEGVGNVEGRVIWLQLWTELVKEFAQHLPDVDMPINYMDESRILVPFDEITKLKQKEEERRKIIPIGETTTKFKGLGHIDAAKLEPYDPVWHGGDSSYWDLVVKTCAPDTPAYGVKSLDDFAGPAKFPHEWNPSYSYKGFVWNWTAAMDPCLQPHLRQLHGTFVNPLSLSSTEELIPLFGGSKLLANNEILIPGAMYLVDDEYYAGGEDHGVLWKDKKDGIVWRGEPSGGRSLQNMWHHFHRHRLVQMLNGTVVSQMEKNNEPSITFEMPSRRLYKSQPLSQGQIGSWLSESANVGFVSLCCEFLEPYYRVVERVPMKEQYGYKFLPDVDGNSFSARYRGFLRSTSLPLKATVYAEWHDDRLVPWMHFVPFDNTFQDLYSVLNFFADGPGEPGDEAAQFIAENGQAWAEQVLRREDMALYVWRLLLEWARICDKNREKLAFVDDLMNSL
ncbi:glycosyltransferase family 90 [Trichoderma arundinaceum]|uniref:Glycosyltransferase family 90 n=1 Tax=Trichoderma arundinaceum TaxID=490622 RepID=A0A395NS77_TRIAR|nr:glycosyltransferase family 90 [Trichoderma arundinaceum]